MERFNQWIVMDPKREKEKERGKKVEGKRKEGKNVIRKHRAQRNLSVITGNNDRRGSTREYVFIINP